MRSFTRVCLWGPGPKITLAAVTALLLGCESRVLDPFPGENGSGSSARACASDGDCAWPAPYCDEALGRCVECRSENDCDRGVCDSATLTCRESCSSNNDCDGRRWLCESGRGVCVECATDSHCDRGIGICEEDACIECRSDNDCWEDEPHCETARSRCRECLEDAQCPEGQHCDSDDRRCESNTR
jgi:Cys-rich repeat protein